VASLQKGVTFLFYNLIAMKNLIWIFLVLLAACSPRFETNYLAIPNGELDDFFSFQSDKQVPLVSAHRGGGEYAGFPENAIQSFEYILRNTPAIIECDVAMTKDSVLLLMHDNTLDRTTTCTGAVNATTWAAIQNCYLEDNAGRGTPFRVPKFADVLQWADGKTVLTVDVKRSVPLEKIVQQIEANDAEDYAAVITYNLRDAKKIYDLNPNLMLSISIYDEAKLEETLRTGIPADNIIAFTGTRQPSPALNQKLHELGIVTIFGTLGGYDEQAEAAGRKGKLLYRQCVENGVDILATDRPIEAAKAIRKLMPKESPQFQYFRSEN